MNETRRVTLPPAAAAKMQAAMSAWQRGDNAGAESLFEELTRRHPRFPDAWHFYGLLLHQRGERRRALETLDHAQSLDPDNFVFLLNFGRVLREAGEFGASLACLQRAHALDPDNGQALAALAESLFALDRGGELLPEIERHLGWAGNNWQLWVLLGECREQGGERSGALAAYAEASRLAPVGEARPHLLRAEAARKDSRYEIAQAEYRTALVINPDSASATLGLAHLASHAGDFEQAERLAREALKRDPDLYAAWELLSTIRSGSKAETLAGELDAVAERAGDNPAAFLLHFARGRVRERLGDYDAAFAAYELGNRIRIGEQRYSRDAQIAYTRNIVEHLDEPFVNRDIAGALPDPGIIFICGMHRSGTTLVETILATHPEVSGGGEMTFIQDWLRRELGMANMSQTGSWLRNAPDALLGQVARDWRESLIEPAAGHARVTDKLPGNYPILGLIHLCFPTAPIVHVRRDPRDNCFSCFATAFAKGYAFSSTLESTGHFYRLYECFIQHWRQTLGAGRIIEIEYEKLVRNPESEVRRLLEAVGLGWDPRCLDFHLTARDVRTASVYQVRQPLYTRSIGRWRHFERHLGPLIAELEAPAPL